MGTGPLDDGHAKGILCSRERRGSIWCPPLEDWRRDRRPRPSINLAVRERVCQLDRNRTGVGQRVDDGSAIDPPSALIGRRVHG